MEPNSQPQPPDSQAGYIYPPAELTNAGYNQPCDPQQGGPEMSTPQQVNLGTIPLQHYGPGAPAQYEPAVTPAAQQEKLPHDPPQYQPQVPVQCVDPHRAGYYQAPAYSSAPPPAPTAAPYSSTVNNNTVVVTQPPASQVVVAAAVSPPPDYFMTSLLVCLCCSPLFGCIALMFSLASQNSASSGDLEAARSQGQVACGLNTFGVVLSIVATIVIFIVMGSA